MLTGLQCIADKVTRIMTGLPCIADKVSSLLTWLPCIADKVSRLLTGLPCIADKPTLKYCLQEPVLVFLSKCFMDGLVSTRC